MGCDGFEMIFLARFHRAQDHPDAFYNSLQGIQVFLTTLGFLFWTLGKPGETLSCTQVKSLGVGDKFAQLLRLCASSPESASLTSFISELVNLGPDRPASVRLSSRSKPLPKYRNLPDRLTGGPIELVWLIMTMHIAGFQPRFVS